MKIVKAPVIKDPSMARYFEDTSNGNKLERLNRPCEDCAVTTGFYTPYAEELVKQKPELQEKVLDTWYCHNHRDKACRGAYNYVKTKTKQSPKED